MADETIHNRDLADRRPARRSTNSASKAAIGRGSVDCGHHLSFETSTSRLRACGWSRHPTGATRSTACTRVRLLPACASCCSSGLRSAPRRRPLGAMRRVGASVPSPRGRPRGAADPTQRSPIASAETPHLLRHLWPVKPSTTGTWPIADAPARPEQRRVRVGEAPRSGGLRSSPVI